MCVCVWGGGGVGNKCSHRFSCTKHVDCYKRILQTVHMLCFSSFLIYAQYSVTWVFITRWLLQMLFKNSSRAFCFKFMCHVQSQFNSTRLVYWEMHWHSLIMWLFSKDLGGNTTILDTKHLRIFSWLIKNGGKLTEDRKHSHKRIYPLLIHHLGTCKLWPCL